MNEVKKTTPEIRFPGYNDVWEQRKLGEYQFYISDGNYGELYPKADEFVDKGIPFIRVNNLKNGYLIHDGLAFISAKLHSVLLSGHIRSDDILITNRGQIGLVAYVDSTFEDANINAQICLIRTNGKMDPRYLHQFLQTEGCQREIVSLQTGTALKQLPRKKLDELLIKAPINIAEQQKIGTYFRTLDHLITLAKRKCGAYAKAKKAMAQKLFAQEIRFKKDDGTEYPEWVEKKLGDLFNISTGKCITSADAEKGGQYNIISGGVSPMGRTNQKNRNAGTITIARAGTAGFVDYQNEDFYLNDKCFSVIPQEDVITTKFSYYELKYRETEIMSYKKGNGVPTINTENLNGIKFYYPIDIAEQEAIADCLSGYDRLIQAAKKELEAYEMLKKCMLQKMFIAAKIL